MRGLLASNAQTFMLSAVYLIKVSTILLEQSFEKRYFAVFEQVTYRKYQT